MKTFREEYNELINWYLPKIKALDDIPWDGISRDGAGTEEKRKLNAEYRKKLKALKEKYSVA